MSGWIYSGTLPSVEDTSRYIAPPEKREEDRHMEPEDYADYLDDIDFSEEDGQ